MKWDYLDEAPRASAFRYAINQQSNGKRVAGVGATHAYGPRRTTGVHEQTYTNGGPADSFASPASIGRLLVWTVRHRRGSMTVSLTLAA